MSTIETEEKSAEKKKPKKKLELFPPLKTLSKANEEIYLENGTIFPNVGKIGSDNHITYIGHSKPVIKLILIKSIKYPNHLCSLSIDGKIKLWNLEEISCLKNINTNFETWDMILGNNTDIVVCGEEIIIINLETEEKKEIVKHKDYKFVEFNLLAKINNDVGVCTSLNDYYLIFDINTGKIIKKIEMNKTHFICQMEKNNKIKIKEENEKRKKDSSNFSPKKDEKNSEKKIVRDLGSGKCEIYEEGHKGHVYALLGINTEENKDSIISGGEDQLIKLININNERKVINLSGHFNTVVSLTLDKTNQYLFSGSLDYTIKKWDLINKNCIGTMEYGNAYKNILLCMDNDYLLTVGINAKITIWNDNSLFVKNYIYTHCTIKSGLIISYNKEFNKTKFVFGDEKGNIFIKQFTIGEDFVNKYKDYILKLQKENENKIIRSRKSKKSLLKSMVKLNFKDKEFEKNFNFKEVTNDPEKTDH